MIPEGISIEPGMQVRHDDGRLYVVENVRNSTVGYELTHEIGGRVVNYTQLEAGDYPVNTPWSKDEDGFREYFTIEKTAPVNPTAHKIQRREFGLALVEILKRGYTLTSREISEIATHYGYSSTNGASDILSRSAIKATFRENGVRLAYIDYANHRIFLDDNLPEADTDLAETERKIDEQIASRSKKS